MVDEGREVDDDGWRGSSGVVAVSVKVGGGEMSWMMSPVRCRVWMYVCVKVMYGACCLFVLGRCGMYGAVHITSIDRVLPSPCVRRTLCV